MLRQRFESPMTVKMRDGETPSLGDNPPVVGVEPLARIEIDSVPKERKTNLRSALPAGSAVCCDCHHHCCKTCEEGSAARQYSDFWICHRCGELNRRAALDAVGATGPLGKD